MPTPPKKETSLLREYADRFLVGFDLFVPAHYQDGYAQQMVGYYRGLLGQLEPDVAALIRQQVVSYSPPPRTLDVTLRLSADSLWKYELVGNRFHFYRRGDVAITVGGVRVVVDRDRRSWRRRCDCDACGYRMRPQDETGVRCQIGFPAS